MTTYEKYTRAKKKYHGHIVLIRIGDFWEAYGDDAQKVGQCCKLTITTRTMRGKPTVAMVGFPYHSFQPLVEMVRRAGHNLVALDAGDITETYPALGQLACYCCGGALTPCKPHPFATDDGKPLYTCGSCQDTLSRSKRQATLRPVKTATDKRNAKWYKLHKGELLVHITRPDGAEEKFYV